MKKYRVSDSELFNLQSMRENLMCELWAMEDGKKNWDYSIYDRLEEVEGLLDKLHGVGSLVDWPTLKRIREIKAERQAIRYMCCLKNGISEREAGKAFAD